MGNLPTLTTPFPVDAFLPVSEVLFPNTSQKRIITATAKTAFKMSDKFFIRIFFLLIIISDFLLYPKFVFFFCVCANFQYRLVCISFIRLLFLSWYQIYTRNSMQSPFSKDSSAKIIFLVDINTKDKQFLGK